MPEVKLAELASYQWPLNSTGKEKSRFMLKLEKWEARRKDVLLFVFSKAFKEIPFALLLHIETAIFGCKVIFVLPYCQLFLWIWISEQLIKLQVVFTRNVVLNQTSIIWDMKYLRVLENKHVTMMMYASSLRCLHIWYLPRFHIRYHINRQAFQIYEDKMTILEEAWCSFNFRMGNILATVFFSHFFFYLSWFELLLYTLRAIS